MVEALSCGPSRDPRADQLHVAMIVPTYLPESFGGAEQQCRKLSSALASLSVRVTILAPRLHSSTPRFEQDGDVSIKRFRVRNAPNLGGRYIGSLLLWSAGVLTWLWTHRSTVDIVHIFHGRLHALPGVIGAALLGKPSLVKIGGGGGEHFDLSVVSHKRLYGPLAYRTLRHYTNGYIANSRQIFADLLTHGVPAERIFEVPNGVEIPNNGTSDVRRPKLGTGPTHYICMGRLDPEKRIDLMLRGFARFPDGSATLTVLGDGDSRHQLEQLASNLGLQGRVAFPGRTEDVSTYLRSAHFYLSTSTFEGMSNALLEAMSFGVVPLVSDVSGATDIVDHGCNGLLFDSRDTSDFVAKLAFLSSITSDTYGLMSAAARDSMRQFEVAQVANQHLCIYRMLAGRIVRTYLPRT
jgi:glycosyltransferase involved in cell wall biosynthesis